MDTIQQGGYFQSAEKFKKKEGPAGSGPGRGNKEGNARLENACSPARCFAKDQGSGPASRSARLPRRFQRPEQYHPTDIARPTVQPTAIP